MRSWRCVRRPPPKRRPGFSARLALTGLRLARLSFQEKGVGYNYGIVPPPEELRAQHDAMMGGLAPNE